MSSIEDLLEPGERIVWSDRPHHLRRMVWRRIQASAIGALLIATLFSNDLRHILARNGVDLLIALNTLLFLLLVLVLRRTAHDMRTQYYATDRGRLIIEKHEGHDCFFLRAQEITTNARGNQEFGDISIGRKVHLHDVAYPLIAVETLRNAGYNARPEEPMTTETAQAPRYVTPIGRPTTINQLFREAAKRGDRPALKRRSGKEWETLSWKTYRTAAHRVANGLLKMGIEKGERVAILSNSRVEWCFCDMAVSGLAACVVPIYQSVKDDEVHYILQDSGARYIFVEDLDQLKKTQLAKKRGGLQALEKIFIFDSTDTEKTKKADVSFDGAMTFDELLEKGEGVDPNAWEERCDASAPDDLLTLVYTSGTTGVPKGVMLTHRNALGECEAIDTALELRESDVILSFLPLAHIFARAIHWCAMKGGYTTAYTSIAKAAEDMQEVRPTCVPSVPRFFEKIYAGIMAKVEEEAPLKRRIAKRSLAWAKEADRRKRERRPLGLLLAVKAALAKPAVSKIAQKMRDKTGGNIRIFVSGGAPLSREVAEFFHMLGFLILEGYGLTETTAGTHVNRIHKYKLGTVGPVVPGVEQKIASDGEILVKGPIVMKGYYNKPDATKDVFDEQGWFKTGDIGEIDGDGFLRITDRKKDLLKTAGGKYVAPQKIENTLKTFYGISQAVLIGDQRPYCTALLTIDLEAMKKIVKERAQREPAGTIEALVKDEAVTKYIEHEIAEMNRELGSYETVKYFRLLPRDFEIGDELTPTLKVKRKRVAEKYGPLIDEMYAAGKAPKGGD